MTARDETDCVREPWHGPYCDDTRTPAAGLFPRPESRHDPVEMVGATYSPPIKDMGNGSGGLPSRRNRCRAVGRRHFGITEQQPAAYVVLGGTRFHACRVRAWGKKRVTKRPIRK